MIRGQIGLVSTVWGQESITDHVGKKSFCEIICYSFSDWFCDDYMLLFCLLKTCFDKVPLCYLQGECKGFHRQPLFVICDMIYELY